MTLFDRRKHGRVNFESKMDYAFNLKDEMLLEGNIVNISASGLCLNTSTELKEEQEIIFKDILPGGYQTATVVWTEKTDDNCYMVGLQFK
jgi:hypothetical protein